MAKPFSLFIRPEASGHFTNWSLVRPWGPVEPEPATGPTFSNYILLSTDGDGRLYAANTGKLSVRPPKSAKLPATDPILTTALGSPSPRYISIYLHLPFLVAIQPTVAPRLDDIGGLAGFYYRYVDPASLSVLGASIDRALLVPKAKTASLAGLTRSQKLELFFRGEIDIYVAAGQEIGQATMTLTTSGRMCGFTALNRQGPIDPSFICDALRDQMKEGQPVIDEYLQLVPKKWPISAGLPNNAVLFLTKHILYPQSVLHDVLNRPGISRSRERELGDNQKSLWRERLLRRIGYADPASTATPFEFDDVDYTNMFQLEAVTELYANFQDPWRGGGAVEGQNRPTPPLLPDGTANPDYTKVDFLNPRGSHATVAGTVVTLDGAGDLGRIEVNQDTLELTNADATVAGRPNPLFRITAIDTATRTLTVHEAPVLTQADSPWEVHLRPVIVIIDAFGTRNDLEGESAVAIGASLTLDGTQSLARVNREFDTVYLPGDTARASRTYRIVTVGANRVLTLDAAPVLAGGSSRWHIPAGVSGRMATYDHTLGPNTQLRPGFDHYDAAVFVVHDHYVREPFHFSSYTSRNNSDQLLSSIRGNKKYSFRSLRSSADPAHPTGPPFRNYCFGVRDAGATYDGAREGRFYFVTPATPDTVEAPGEPNILGKTGIRIHNGSRNGTGSGSGGCIVSPSFYDLRDMLVEIYLDEHLRVNGTSDLEMGKLLGRNAATSATLWRDTENQTRDAPHLEAVRVNGKIRGTVWLIRPDEKPEVQA